MVTCLEIPLSVNYLLTPKLRNALPIDSISVRPNAVITKGHYIKLIVICNAF